MTVEKGQQWEAQQVYMARITQVLTFPSKEYSQLNAQSLNRDLDAVLQKLNTTFQQDLKDEIEAFNFFIN